MTRTSLCFLLAGLVAASSATGANWPQWRGPEFNGASPEKNLPQTWSKSENVVWSADMPGPSAATPIVWNARVFVSAADEQSGELLALCLDRKTGRVLWKHAIDGDVRRDDKSNFASPSPATDGQRVVFFYGSGPMIAFDLEGNQLWSRNIQEDFGEFAFLWTFATSPLLYEGRLYLQVLQRDVPVRGRGGSEDPNESYLLALDPQTGKKLFQHIRPSEAQAESREGFTTPIPYEYQGRQEILIAGGDAISGHDPDTGKELWRWGTWNPRRVGHWRLVPSPVAGDGVVLVCAPKREPIFALPAGQQGALDDSDLLWTSRDHRVLSSDVPTPAFHDGDFIVLSDVRGALSRVSARSGELKWSIEMPGRTKFEASPTVADGKVYCMNFAGDVVVVDVDDGKVLAEISMGERWDDFIRSSIAVADEHLFIRTNSKLFCVGAGWQ